MICSLHVTIPVFLQLWADGRLNGWLHVDMSPLSSQQCLWCAVFEGTLLHLLYEARTF